MRLRVLSLMLAFAVGSQAFADNMVVNGDFEDSGVFNTWPGYVANDGNPADIGSWTGDGGRGINPIDAAHDNQAPFRDNGNNDTKVAFLQGVSYIEQSVAGFTPGLDYVLSLDFNARNCCGATPVGIVSLDGNEVASSLDLPFPDGGVVPVGDGEDWYSADIPFTATGESHVLRISTNPSGAGGDSTLIVDNVSISVVPEPTTAVSVLLGLISLAVFRKRR